MLLIVMYRKEAAIKSLLALMREENVAMSTIAGTEMPIGSLLFGDLWDNNLIFQKGGITDRYDKAVMALIHDKTKAMRVSGKIEDSLTSIGASLNNEAVICALPFHRVKALEKIF